MARHRSRRSFLTAGALGSAAAAAAPLAGLAEAVERAPRSSSPSDLKITGVRGGLIRGQHSLFVKVETNQGIYGCAEAVDGVYGSYYVMKHIAERHLVGQSPLDVHRLQEEMRRGGLFKGAQGGMYVCVMTALETALWDLVGKALGLPVYQLLGGKFRDRIRVYCDTGGSRMEPDGDGPAREGGRREVRLRRRQVRHRRRLRPEQARPLQLEREPGRARADARADRRRAGGRGPERRHLRRLPRPLRRGGRPPDREGDGAVRPHVAGGAGPGRVPRGLRAHPPGDDDADLRRRELVPHLRLPPAARDRRVRRGHARPAEVRRARRGAAHREPREHVRRAVRAAHGRVVPRRDGLGPRVRVGPELPDPRVADLLPHRADVQGDRDVRRPDAHERRPHPAARRARASASTSTRTRCGSTR